MGWPLFLGQQGHERMIKANGSIITTITEALQSREHPYLKYRPEPLKAALHSLIFDVDLHKRQSERCRIWFTGRDSACRGVSTFPWIPNITDVFLDVTGVDDMTAAWAPASTGSELDGDLKIDFNKIVDLLMSLLLKAKTSRTISQKKVNRRRLKNKPS